MPEQFELPELITPFDTTYHRPFFVLHRLLCEPGSCQNTGVEIPIS